MKFVDVLSIKFVQNFGVLFALLIPIITPISQIPKSPF